MGYNSTIRIREKICVSCGKPCYWFSKKRCKQCATVEDFHAKEEQLAFTEEDLQDLIKECDKVTSLYVRMKAMDANKKIKCYTCDKEMDLYDAQCGHFISRSQMFLRFDLRNLRPQCNSCNCYKRGNIAIYRKRLNEEHPGLADILMEESYLIYKMSRDEIKSLIREYSEKIKQLK